MFSNYASKDANFPHWPKSQSSSLMSFHVNLYVIIIIHQNPMTAYHLMYVADF